MKHTESRKRQDGRSGGRRQPLSRPGGARRLFALLLSLLLLAPVLSPARASWTDMQAVQERLLALGYEIGEADGIIGAKSQAALRLVQTLLKESGYRLSVTGMPDALTVELMNQEENEELLRTMLVGSWGARVRDVQKRLAEYGFLADRADGQFGQNTEAAVRAFEDWVREEKPELIVADGRLSVGEYQLLMSDLRSMGLQSPRYYNPDDPASLEPGYLYARHAILMDAVTGEVLLQKDADAQAAPASTTKILTLLTALSLCDPDREITVPQAAAEVPADSSLVPVYPGEVMTMRDLLYAMIIRSGNDAANAVAALCSGSVEAFVEEMNRTAASLGMTNSHFVNPHGYSAEGHYTSARDLATVTREGLTNPEFLRIVTCYQYVLPATALREELPIVIQWPIFNPESEYYIPHAAGIKSGYTSEAGFCYVGAYQENGVTLIAAVLGCSGSQSAWTDLRRLFAYGMTQR